jgi:hypothetical protein
MQNQEVGQCENMIQSMRSKISFLKEKLNPNIPTQSNDTHLNSSYASGRNSSNVNMQSQLDFQTSGSGMQNGHSLNTKNNLVSQSLSNLRISNNPMHTSQLPPQ